MFAQKLKKFVTENDLSVEKTQELVQLFNESLVEIGEYIINSTDNKHQNAKSLPTAKRITNTINQKWASKVAQAFAEEKELTLDDFPGIEKVTKAHMLEYIKNQPRTNKSPEFKVENTYEFWKSTIKNCSSSYKKWVHPFEASKHNALYFTKEKSIYCKERCQIEDSPIEQLTKSGIWSFQEYKFIPNCYLIKKIVNGNELYYFSGLIAHIRVLSITSKKKSLVCLLCDGNQYFEMNTIGNHYFSPKSYMLSGIAKLDSKITNSYIAKSFKYINK